MAESGDTSASQPVLRARRTPFRGSTDLSDSFWKRISRKWRQTKWAGYGVLGAALSSLGFAESAEALTRRQRRRCRRKGGTPLERGECNCAFNCETSPEDIVCEDNPNCSCTQTIEGRGFCADFFVRCPTETCSSSSECPRGSKCLVNTCCDGPAVCLPSCPPSTMSAPRVSGMTPGGPRGG